MNTIQEAQKDMREAYANGVPGIFASAIVWITAGLVALFTSPFYGILTLVFGGMLIFPISLLFCKAVGRAGSHDKNNPLAPLAIEGTLWMLLLIPVAAGAAFYRIEWFFPAMLFIIAGRYLTFATLYGIRIYWFLGLALVLTSIVFLLLNLPTFICALAGGGVELVFALVIFKLTEQKDSVSGVSTAAKEQK